MAPLLTSTVVHDYPLMEGSEINAQWVKAIRTSWKQIAADLKDYEGRVDHHPKPTPEVLTAALNASRKALTLLGNYINNLSEDLLFNKGLWELPSEAGKAEIDETRRWKTIIVTELRKAKDIVEKYFALNEDKRKKVEQKKVSKAEYEKIIGRAHTYVEKAVTQAHAVIMGILSKLHKVHQHHAGQGKVLDQGSFAPRINHIGQLTVIFDDVLPGDPTQIGSETTKVVMGGNKLHRSIAAVRVDHKNRERLLYRHPKYREQYLPLVKKALAALDAKGLGWLAYGQIHVRPEGATKFTNTQAAYQRNNDKVYIYCNPKRALPGSIVHEYGHRYWYKFMTEQDRRNFSKWFGDVPAVSTYGATSTWEDFAEVFKYYVEGRKLTKDQRDRFTQFMKGKVPKVEWLEEGKIDDQWITGIRAGWKMLMKQTQKFKGRRSKAPKIDFQYIHDASDSGAAALQNVKRYIGRLRDDLLLNKGFWDLPSDAPGKKELGIIRRYRTKVIDELDAAEEAIDDGIVRVAGAKTDAQEVDRFGHTGYWYQQLQSDKEKFDWYLNGIGVNVDDALKGADAAISNRLLRHLSKMLASSYTYVTPHGVGGAGQLLRPSDTRLVKKTVPIDWGEHEPEVVHLGKATVVFQDMPSHGLEGGGIISPRRVGSSTVSKKETGEKLTARTKYGGGYMHPKRRKEFIDGLKEVQQRLQGKRLSNLFRGVFKVEPAERAGTNPLGAHFGVGGVHNRLTNEIRLYGTLKSKPAIVRLVLHELGHRYYYKHMTPEDRHNFDKWFGRVSAVSKYGATTPAEDFAEVFAYYVLGEHLTKDQIQRFRQFMTGERPRTEAIEESTATKAQKCKYCDEPAAVSLIWADGRAYIPVCNAHETKARNVIRGQRDSVCDVKQVERGPFAPPTQRGSQIGPQARAESYYPPGHPAGLMQSALEPALAFVGDEGPGAYFGLQASPQRTRSAFQEAPEDTTPRAPYGRRSAPRGAVFTQHSGPDIRGITGKPITRVSVGKQGKGTSGYTRKIVKTDSQVQEIPDSLLQMLGTDWTTMRAHRVHDNRMTINIDGVRYSVYTRRG